MKTPNIQLCTQCADQCHAEAQTYCEECSEYLCKDCLKAHQRTKLTKDHTLRNIHPLMDHQGGGDGDNNLSSLQTLCDVAQHSNLELTTFCELCGQVICEKCFKETHFDHVTKPIEKAHRENLALFSQLCLEIERIDFKEMQVHVDKQTVDARQKGKELHKKVESDFERFQTALRKSIDDLRGSIDRNLNNFLLTCGDIKQKLLKLENETKKVLTDSDHLKNGDKVHFLKSYSDITERLKNARDTIPKMKEFQLEYKNSLTTEELATVISLAGSVHSLSSLPDDATDSTCRSQLMEVLKSYTDSRRLSSSIYSQTTADLPGMAEASNAVAEAVVRTEPHFFQTLDDLAEPLSTDSLQMGFLKDESNLGGESQSYLRGELSSRIEPLPSSCELPGSFEEYTVDITRAKSRLLQTEAVKAMLRMRFRTWELRCNWEIVDDKIKVRGVTRADCEKAMEIIQESVQEETVYVLNGATQCVPSDAWKTMTDKLARVYTNQVSIEVSTDRNKVLVYAASTAILKDSCDTIRLFMRSQQVKTVSMEYGDDVVAYVMRHRKTLLKLQDKLSMSNVRITKQNASTIAVTGCGDGLAEALRTLHVIASRLGRETEENRFDSANEDSDEEPRFTDEDEESSDSVAVTNVKLKLSTGETEYDIAGLVFLEGRRLLYVVGGDITKLPAEVIVSPANTKLKHDGGLAKVLVQKGGWVIQEESSFHVQTHGSVPEGQVFCSTAGSLPFTAIIHAVGPRWKDGCHDETKRLADVVRNSLKALSGRKQASVAFPTISAGSFRFPREMASEIIVKDISDFLRSVPDSSVREIYLCDTALESVVAFVGAVRRQFGLHACITSGMPYCSPPASSQGASQFNEERRAILLQSFFQLPQS